MADKTILATITGEFYQPVRLHYRVFDDKGLLQAFRKLSCVKEDLPRQRWVWLYDHEAKGLTFKQSYAQIPENLRPVVLGSLSQRPNDKLVLDLRSGERALAAIPFFDAHIPRSVAELTEAEVANKVYTTENAQPRPEDLFDHQPSAARDPKAEFKRLTEQVTQGRSIRARLDIALNVIRSATGQPLPETERVPIHYYEDGIEGFELALTLRQIVAKEHCFGNPGYTLFDAIAATTKAM
jgi:hypothetical protein